MLDRILVVAAWTAAVLGVSLIVGVFTTLGPLDTPRRTARAGWTLLGIAFLLALTQSTPTAGRPQTARTAIGK